MKITKLQSFVPDESIKDLIDGMHIPLYVTADEMLSYEEYKAESLDQKNGGYDMHILELLDMLGFPMDENGTYLFKEVVKSITNNLRLGLVLEEDLVIKIENPYSQFYFDIARNDLDLGVKCFHAHLEKMLEKTDLTNSSLGVVVFGDLKEANYGIAAYRIAEYIVQILNMNPELYETSTRKRKIVNFSDYAWHKMV